MRKFFLVSVLLAQSIWANEPERDVFEGSIVLTVPGDRLLDTLQVGVDFEEVEDLILREDQKSADSDNMMQIGSKALITLGKNYKQKIRFKNSKMTSSEAVFYLFEQGDELKSIFIEPKYYTKGTEFNSDGKTEPVFRIEVFEVGTVGDTEGRLMKSIENLSLHIGKENEIVINQPINSGTRVGVRLSAMETEDSHVLHIPVKKAGNYLCQYDDGVNEGYSKYYNAAIGFRYLRKDTAAKNRRLRAFQMVADEINNFVRNSSSYGSPRVVEIPVKIRMRLAPKGVAEANRIVIGPPAPEKPLDEKKEDPKRKKNFLGF
ncbi:MAG: hypothetical protein H3C47_08280 [Candidatus Cloacimonetes bacterium]|nr:hypothetical protein [Candidatus Cloacimonadota bacterium]